MRALTIVGLVLVALGVVGLFFGGVSWTKDREKADLGLFEVTLEEKEHLTIHPAVGGVLLVAGGAVLWFGRRSR